MVGLIIVAMEYADATGKSWGPATFAAVAAALVDRPSRVLHVGVPRDSELRRYGSPKDHAAAHGLDAPGIRAQIKELVG